MAHLSAVSSGPVPSMVREPGGAPLHAHPSSRGTAVSSWPISALAGLVCALLFLSSDGPGPPTYTGPSIAQLLAWISCSQRAPDLPLCHSLNLIFDYSFSATDDRKDVKAPLVEEAYLEIHWRRPLCLSGTDLVTVGHSRMSPVLMELVTNHPFSNSNRQPLLKMLPLSYHLGFTRASR